MSGWVIVFLIYSVSLFLGYLLTKKVKSNGKPVFGIVETKLLIQLLFLLVLDWILASHLFQWVIGGRKKHRKKYKQEPKKDQTEEEILNNLIQKVIRMNMNEMYFFQIKNSQHRILTEINETLKNSSVKLNRLNKEKELAVFSYKYQLVFENVVNSMETSIRLKNKITEQITKDTLLIVNNFSDEINQKEQALIEKAEQQLCFEKEYLKID